jgi:hypothetical protein
MNIMLILTYSILYMATHTHTGLASDGLSRPHSASPYNTTTPTTTPTTPTFTTAPTTPTTPTAHTHTRTHTHSSVVPVRPPRYTTAAAPAPASPGSASSGSDEVR